MKLLDRFNNKAEGVSLITLTANSGLAVLKGVFGLMYGSSALVADAFHSISDILSSGVVFLGVKAAKRPPDTSHHYGHGKIESVASKIVSLILIATAVAIGYNSIQLFVEGTDIPGRGAIVGAIISVLVKEILFRYNSHMGSKLRSGALKADAWHNRSDALSSLAALGGIVGAILGYPILDPIGALFVAGLILKMGIKIYMRSISELIDTAPSSDKILEIREIVVNTPGIKNVQDIKGRYHGSNILLDLKVCVDKDSTVEAGHGFAAEAKARLLEEISELENALIHVNPCFDESGSSGSCEECEKNGSNLNNVRAEYQKDVNYNGDGKS